MCNRCDSNRQVIKGNVDRIRRLSKQAKDLRERRKKESERHGKHIKSSSNPLRKKGWRESRKRLNESYRGRIKKLVDNMASLRTKNRQLRDSIRRRHA